MSEIHKEFIDIFETVRARIEAVNNDLIAAGLLPAGIDQSRVLVEPPRDVGHGDLATNAAMVLAKDAKRKPRELAEATLGMIGGQYLDVTGADAGLDEIHRLKTGRLFAASVGLGLRAAGVPEPEQAPWRAFGEELGLLFQVVDDILDGDGYAARLGPDAAREIAARAAERACAALDAIPADTRVLRAIVLLNPMSYVVDAVRGLCLGVHHFPIALDVAVALAAALAFGALARRAFNKMEV